MRFFKDTDLKYRFVSHLWAQINSKNILGKTDSEVRIDRENVEQAEKSDREIIKSKKGAHYYIKSDIDGEVSYLELIKEPIIGKDNKTRGIVGLINDITEKETISRNLKKLNEEYAEKCTQLETANSELRLSLNRIEEFHKAHKLFMTSMNHELRNPLNGISGILQLLMKDDTLNEEQHQKISAAFQSSQFMLSIINDLLDFARFETKQFSISEAPFSLRGMLEEIEYVSLIESAAKDLSFKTTVRTGEYDIFVGDEVRIRQIINNLVSNAIKYTSEGSVSLEVLYENGKLTINCSDTGQGIAEEDIPALYEPYARFNGKKNNAIQGTGLGLPIVKKIVERMKGEIRVSSKVNAGSTFTVIIPLAVYDGIEYNIANENTTEDNDLEIDYSRLTALCVDDSAVNADVLAALLNELGMKTETLNSGREAVSRAEQVKFDLIFMDHMMPGMDGIEALKQIRGGNGVNRTTPIVMLTGNTEDECEEYYKSLGADGYLPKPVLLGRIEKTVKSLCGRQ